MFQEFHSSCVITTRLSKLNNRSWFGIEHNYKNCIFPCPDRSSCTITGVVMTSCRLLHRSHFYFSFLLLTIFIFHLTEQFKMFFVSFAFSHMPFFLPFSSARSTVRSNMTEFWKEHSQAATVEEMMLDSRAKELTEQELPEILSMLPPLTESRVLELGAGIGWAELIYFFFFNHFCSVFLLKYCF